MEMFEGWEEDDIPERLENSAYATYSYWFVVFDIFINIRVISFVNSPTVNTCLKKQKANETIMH